MRINSVNNNQVAFGGLFSAIKARRAAKQAQALAQRAEKQLQNRLVSYKILMRDFDSNLIVDKRTGKPFSGKYVVPAGEWERIFHVKNGKTVGYLTRYKTGRKMAATYNGKEKRFFQELSDGEASNNCQKMFLAASLAEERMKDNFVMHKLMESGKDFIVLHYPGK